MEISKEKTMFDVKVIFANPPDNPKSAAEQYVMAMYGKTLLEFARYMTLQSPPEQPPEGKEIPLVHVTTDRRGDDG